MKQLLNTIVGDPVLHARFLNGLARMEYVGVRKMLKSRSSDHLGEDGLQHVLEESSHALRLKRAALGLAPEPDQVATFADAQCLGGRAGEDYMQGVDAAAEAALQDLPEERRGEINYLLSSLVIELRAEAFYPAYESCLQEAGAGVSVASIVKDELRHLAEMERRLDGLLPDWRERLPGLRAREQALFDAWLAALQLDSSRPRRGPGLQEKDHLAVVRKS